MLDRLDRDEALRDFVGSLVGAVQQEWGDHLVTEPDSPFHPAHLYTETHLALAAVLLALGEGAESTLMDFATSRLEMWNRANGPMTFFNAMAVCLAAVVCRREGVEHRGLQRILEDLLARTRDHRHVAFKQWCGNNVYLQQVAVDTILLPLARERQVSAQGMAHLVAEFRKYRTDEGFFYDLPRVDGARERLCPPTYVVKMLFLAGVCHELTGSPELEDLFTSGMEVVAPLLTRDGQFSYFGRTDNSPFAAGLTIFNLRKAAQMTGGGPNRYAEACLEAERYYMSSPRTPLGMLRCNRFSDGETRFETRLSLDEYAQEAEYSLSSSAYALLGCRWFPSPSGQPAAASPGTGRGPAVATSRDLGLVKLDTGSAEVVLRTAGEITAWDRRYLGPTVLRYRLADTLLVGATAKTVATDDVLQPSASGRGRRLYNLFRRRFTKGFDQLDGTSVGFLPVLRDGTMDYLPGGVVEQEVSPTHVRTRHRMVGLRARGWWPCFLQAATMVHNKLRLFGPKRYSHPPMVSVDTIELHRDVWVDGDACRIVDRITGDVTGKRVVFTVRSFPTASVVVRGLQSGATTKGWGSDGRQDLEVYEGVAQGELRYECEIRPSGTQLADRRSAS